LSIRLVKNISTFNSGIAGKDFYRLSIEEMPKHTHALSGGWDGSTQATMSIMNRTVKNVLPTTAIGDNKPFNIEPRNTPYRFFRRVV